MKINQLKCLKFKSIQAVITLLFVGLISSCAFQKNMKNLKPVTDINNLNGRYEINSINEDKVTKKYWMYNNLLKELDRKLLTDTFKIDSNQFYTIELKVLSNRAIKINYLENGKTIRERTLAAKLKKDGYVYLKNKNIGFILIPYIAGAIDIKKSRLSTTEDGNLIFDVVNHRSGAIGIVGFLDGRTWKYRKIYPKITKGL